MSTAQPSINTIKLGSQGLQVTAQGYGCMGLTSFYNSKLTDAEAIAMLVDVAARGVTFWDTANLYIYPQFSRLLTLRSPIVCQEELIGKAIAQVGRDKLTIATKTGIRLNLFPKPGLQPCGQPAFLREQCNASLARLGIECIDLFYIHRIDPDTPIEVSMMEMKRLVEEGKIKYVGLSECSAATIRRAHKVHAVSAVQMEYSLWCRGIEGEVMQTCKELGIGVVAYSPLGRGFLTGSSSTAASGKFARMDYRASLPRLVGENLEKNREMLERVEKIAEEKGVSTSQLALAWLQAQQGRVDGAGVVAIPGTTKIKNLESNIGSLAVELTEEEVKTLEEAVPDDEFSGDRVNDELGWEFDKNRELTETEAMQLGI